MTDLKNVVIIGAAAGATLARALEKSLPPTHRIVLIDANESAYWPIGGVRGAVKPGYEDRLFARLDTFFPKNSRHVMLNKTKVTAISPTSLTLDHAVEPFGESEIPFDYAVLATGSIYASPCRPASTATAEAKAALRQQQSDIASATSILIIGAGPVAIEFAGEILHLYPSKKVTLVARKDVLLGGKWIAKFPAKLEAQLKKHGAEILYNTTLSVPEQQLNTLFPEPQAFSDDAGANVVSADYVVAATGGRPNTELVPQEALENGRIAVDKALRLTYPPLAERWFAMGDVCNAPGDKSFFSAYLQSFVVAAHIKAAVKNKGESAKAAWKPSWPTLTVPIGPNDGSTILMGCVLGAWFTSNFVGKSLLHGKFTQIYGKEACSPPPPEAEKQAEPEV